MTDLHDGITSLHGIHVLLCLLKIGNIKCCCNFLKHSLNTSGQFIVSNVIFSLRDFILQLLKSGLGAEGTAILCLFLKVNRHIMHLSKKEESQKIVENFVPKKKCIDSESVAYLRCFWMLKAKKIVADFLFCYVYFSSEIFFSTKNSFCHIFCQMIQMLQRIDFHSTFKLVASSFYVHSKKKSTSEHLF